MSFTEYVIAMEIYRKLRDMSDLVYFNEYTDFDEFERDVHVMYDGTYDSVLDANKNFYHLLIDGKKCA